jgi:hypothetical protein
MTGLFFAIALFGYVVYLIGRWFGRALKKARKASEEAHKIIKEYGRTDSDNSN